MNPFSSLAAYGLGASLMYFFDIDSGRRRRARVRDKKVHYLTQGKHLASKKARHYRNIVVGVGSQARHTLMGHASGPLLTPGPKGWGRALPAIVPFAGIIVFGSLFAWFAKEGSGGEIFLPKIGQWNINSHPGESGLGETRLLAA